MNSDSHLERQKAIEHLLESGWLKSLDWAEEVDSTNTRAKSAIDQGNAVLPALWVADRQTAGRGRNQNQWWSPPGCLMLSLAIDESDLPSELSLRSALSLVIGVALLKAAQSLTETPGLRLKWPNDIYVNDRKLAGILIECVPRTRHATGDESTSRSMVRSTSWVIGIGLNVAVPWNEAPTDVAQRATCLTQASGKSLSVELALIEVIESIHRELIDWRLGESNWFELWNDTSLLSQRTVRLRLPDGQEIVGWCEGIDMSGQLILRQPERRQLIQSAEILSWS